MKASNLITLLLRSPDSDVLFWSPLSRKPVPFDSDDIALNNEANAWLIYTPSLAVAQTEIDNARRIAAEMRERIVHLETDLAQTARYCDDCS